MAFSQEQEGMHMVTDEMVRELKGILEIDGVTQWTGVSGLVRSIRDVNLIRLMMLIRLYREGLV
jgi:hypothetical protein